MTPFGENAGCYCRVPEKVPYLNVMRLVRTSALLGLLLLPRTVAAQTFDHATLDNVVSRFVSDDGIRYRDLAADRKQLDVYVASLGRVSETQFAGWPRNEKLAYLINAYNALVLQRVIDHYPIKRSLNPAALVRPANSVWQIGGFFDETRAAVAGRPRTLDDIEHKLLREALKEPRIHAALVCAARSCPPLRREAFVADKLDAQLDQQWRVFLNDRARNLFDRERGEVKLSEIMKWFAEDFGGTNGVISFVSRYVDAPTQMWLRGRKYRITYFDYDWTLNDAAQR